AAPDWIRNKVVVFWPLNVIWPAPSMLAVVVTTMGGLNRTACGPRPQLKLMLPPPARALARSDSGQPMLVGAVGPEGAPLAAGRAGPAARLKAKANTSPTTRILITHLIRESD